MTSDADARAAVAEGIRASARYLDAHDFDRYTALYAADGEYRIEVRAPELREPMIWMVMNRTELVARLAAVPRHEWQILQPLQTRLVTLDVVAGDPDGMRAESPFVVFNTDADGRSQCYAVGRYLDHWRPVDGDWRLQSRRVALQTRLLNPPTPIPL